MNWPRRVFGRGFGMRQMTEADVPACPDLHRAEKLDPAWFPSTSFTVEVLRRKSGFAVVFEDLRAPSRVVGFGVSAFIRRKCADRLRDYARAGKLREVVETLHSRDLFEGESEVAKANADEGLKVVVYGTRADEYLEPEGRIECSAVFTRGFLETHAGFQIDEFLFIAASQENIAYLLHGGAVFEGNTESGPPWLLTLTNTAGRETKGTIFAVIFQAEQPIFCLSEAQRELLILALDGLTDGQIAQTAHISEAAVKKRWAAVFDQVFSTAPALLPFAANDGTRGPEKRGALLSYLRLHPEELRPWPKA